MSDRIKILYARNDGSFVIKKDDNLYHVVQSDVMFDDVAAAAQSQTLLPEPVLPPLSMPKTPISAMQLSTALLSLEAITAQEARAFGRSGIIPPRIETSLRAALVRAGLPVLQQEIALLKVESATEYHRDHPLTAVIGAAIGLDTKALDDLWTNAGKIL